MTPGLWVILSNAGGVLDQCFAETGEEAAQLAATMIRACGTLYDGDRITIEAGESER